MKKAIHKILITGAGPAGLSLATELTRRNIACTIIDKASGPASLNESRALAFNARSQNILSASGVAERIRAAAHQVDSLSICWRGQLRNDVSLSSVSKKSNALITIRQGQVEREMLKHLAEQGVEVLWETELVKFVETNNTVVATLSDKKNEMQNYECRYLIGCDGAHSYVRKNGGYTFDGETDSQLWTLADATVQDNRFSHTVTVDFSPGKAFATVAIEENMVRFIHNGPNLLEQHPFAHLATAIHWESDFKVSYRLVKQYNRGLTFLCGDAAHIHSPVGGRGMNLGIEDAATLAWLLEQGRESEYTKVRRPVAQHVLKLTHKQTSQINSSSAATSLLKKFGPKLVSIPKIRRGLVNSLHGIDTPEPAWF